MTYSIARLHIDSAREDAEMFLRASGFLNMSPVMGRDDIAEHLDRLADMLAEAADEIDRARQVLQSGRHLTLV